ncbi:VC0807 family protein [Opitutus sp. ER46]|uniref:VC0807 family protein n=1 Tax=Opitutus sp. ER46 TaxID=2161864 RepID=UPI000D31F56B|nr:VC0807 family protein [Opitutus sp. ER46]PTX92450.1 MFS transporter [Opitutus sp. ER46]
MSKPPPKRENVLLNLLCNIVIPTVILMKFSTDRFLGPLWGLLVALAFPFAYGVYDLLVRRKTNLLSILGFISVLLSGGLGLMKVGGLGFAIKDAAVPLVIGAAVLLSLRSKKPLVRELLLNEQIVDVEKVTAALEARQTMPAFDRLLRNASLWLAFAFVGSAILNFILARWILRSPPATPEFNAELGKMHILVWPVIVIPSMVVLMYVFWKLMRGLSELTGLSSDEIFHPEKPKS